jgi:hypothetical protein
MSASRCWSPGFAALDEIAAALEAHLDVDTLLALAKACPR